VWRRSVAFWIRDAQIIGKDKILAVILKFLSTFPLNLLAAAWGRAGVIRPHGAEPSDNDGHYQSWPFLKPPHVAIMRKRHRANELA
jgi:hypothetical protein